MRPSQASISQAYTTLGLEQGASFDVVKSAYKKIALRTHPDKNPDNPDATQEFQAVGEAYTVLERHLDPNQDEDEDEWDDGGYGFDDMAEFYMFMFEEIFARASARAYAMPRGYRRPQRQQDWESPQQYQERVLRNRQDQIAAEARRKEEAIARKRRQEEERERDRLQAEQRKADAIKAKKAQGEKERQDAAATVNKARRKAQEMRSAVFTAARKGLSDKVKSGVWDDNIDASGGEIKPGCEELVSSPPKDPKETLLHIAVKQGNLDLVEWLQSHNADDEATRNGEDLTPFHVALREGHIPIVNYFLENHPPKDDDYSAIYRSPKSTSSLQLAILSHEPEVVYLVLNNSLASTEEINASWAWTTSSQGRKTMSKRADHKTAANLERFNDILKLLMRYGGFTPPPTPTGSAEDLGALKAGAQPAQSKKAHQRAQSQADTLRTPSPSPAGRGNGRGKGRGRGRGRG